MILRTALVCSICLLLAGSAVADRGSLRDRNDTKGSLDIERAVHKHLSDRPNVFVHKIVMHRRWTKEDIANSPRRARSIRVSFNTKPEEYLCCDPERMVTIYSRGGAIRAVLFDVSEGRSRRMSKLRWWRPSRRSIAFAIKKRQLRRSSMDYYQWAVTTFYTARSIGCRARDACMDQAPDDYPTEMFRHDL